MFFVVALFKGLMPWIPSVLALTTSGQSYELDLIFPQNNGRYHAPDGGLPMIMAVQNSPAAFAYGYSIFFDFYPTPRGGSRLGSRTVIFSHHFGSLPPSNATNPYIVSGVSGYLKPGAYEVGWSIGIQNWCEFKNTTQETSAAYSDNLSVLEGSINLTILSDVNATQADAPPNLVSNDNSRQCPLDLGVISMASTSTYTLMALTVNGLGTQTSQYVYPASAVPCVVRTTVSESPSPCAVTINAPVQASLYSQMGWAKTSTEVSSTSRSSLVVETSPTRTASSSTRLLPRLSGLWNSISALLVIAFMLR